MITYRVLTDKNEKQIIKKDFFTFFKIVYKKDLTDILWEHQFINSPYENSPLFLVLSNKTIIASALMIKQKSIVNNKIYNYYLFTSSAVLKEYRSEGIYIKLLKKQKEYALKKDIDFIFAFPNKLAYPILKTFGGFKDIQKLNLIKTTLMNINTSHINSLIIDSNMFNWRFEHKDYKFYKKNKKIFIYKYFEGCAEILAIYDEIEFSYEISNHKLSEKEEIMVLDSSVKNKTNILTSDILHATYYPFKKDINCKDIKINLLMSDVF